MTVLCVNSTVVYADIAAADAAEGGTDFGVPTRFEQTGTSSTAVQFVDVDYLSSFIYIATAGEETTGDIAVGAQMTAMITTGVDNGVIESLRVNIVSSGAALNHHNQSLIASGSGQDLFIFGSNTGTDDNCIAHDCSEGWRSGSTNNNHISTNCTAIDCSGFGFLRPRVTDTVALNTSSATYLQEGASSSNYWADDSNGSDAITEGTPTDIFEDYAGGDYRIKASSSVGAAGAGAFISAGGGISGTITEIGPSFTESINISVSKNITSSIAESGPSFTESISATLSGLVIEASITENGPSFTDSINVNIDVSIAATITELGPSFSESITASLLKDTVITITESGPSFSESIIASIPVIITVNPKNIISVKRQSISVIIKRNSNSIRVKRTSNILRVK